MIVGIDIAKLKFDALLLLKTGKEKHKTFTNDTKGFEAFNNWFLQAGGINIHACMEATGSYGEALALFLCKQNIKVSIINPTQIKAYARSEGVRVKTDKVDAGVIARFCKTQCPPAWTPPTEQAQQLKDLYRCRQTLLDDRGRSSNRLEGLNKNKPSFKVWQDLIKSLDKQLKDVESQIKALIETDEDLKKNVDLLLTIPGIGQTTAVAILAELPNINGFESAKEVAAFAGLTPAVRQSGTSVHGIGHISKVGNSGLRKCLFLPAMVAKQYNPILIGFCERLGKKGKAKMVIIIAAMRKLLHIIFGVLKNQQEFNGGKEAIIS